MLDTELIALASKLSLEIKFPSNDMTERQRRELPIRNAAIIYSVIKDVHAAAFRQGLMACDCAS